MSSIDPSDFVLYTSESSWYDLWHTHVDWKGEGNGNPVLFENFLAALFQILDQAVTQTAQWDRPSNVWLIFITGHSEDNAVYVHTPNPNGTPFPYAFEGVSWGVPAPTEIVPYLRPEHEVGFSRYNGDMYWVRIHNTT